MTALGYQRMRFLGNNLQMDRNLNFLSSHYIFHKRLKLLLQNIHHCNQGFDYYHHKHHNHRLMIYLHILRHNLQQHHHRILHYNLSRLRNFLHNQNYFLDHHPHIHHIHLQLHHLHIHHYNL